MGQGKRKSMANSVVTKGAPRAKTDGFFKRLFKFLREAYIEVRFKASWPSWTELKKFCRWDGKHTVHREAK